MLFNVFVGPSVAMEESVDCPCWLLREPFAVCLCVSCWLCCCLRSGVLTRCLLYNVCSHDFEEFDDEVAVGSTYKHNMQRLVLVN